MGVFSKTKSDKTTDELGTKQGRESTFLARSSVVGQWGGNSDHKRAVQ